MIKKGFTLAEIMVVVLIFAVVSVSTMMITKSKNNYVNKYMSYTAFTNLQEGIGELIADGYDSNSDGTLEAVLPPFGHAGATPVCNTAPIISISPTSSSASIPYTTSASTTSGSFSVTGETGTGTGTVTITMLTLMPDSTMDTLGSQGEHHSAGAIQHHKEQTRDITQDTALAGVHHIIKKNS